MNTFTATHEIKFTSIRGEVTTWEVMLDDEGPAYTREEWEQAASASWSRDPETGEWLCEGQATPGGANGTVEVSEIGAHDATTLRTEVDGTTVSTAYADIAPMYGERREYGALGADDREWWDATLARIHAVAVAAARLPAEARDRVIHAGSDADLEAAIGAQERALAEEIG